MSDTPMQELKIVFRDQSTEFYLVTAETAKQISEAFVRNALDTKGNANQRPFAYEVQSTQGGGPRILVFRFSDVLYIG